MKNYFGENIKKIRLMSGLTQAEMAKLHGVSLRAYINWENNGVLPRTEKLKELGDFYHENPFRFGCENYVPSEKTIGVIVNCLFEKYFS